MRSFVSALCQQQKRKKKKKWLSILVSLYHVRAQRAEHTSEQEKAEKNRTDETLHEAK